MCFCNNNNIMEGRQKWKWWENTSTVIVNPNLFSSLFDLLKLFLGKFTCSSMIAFCSINDNNWFLFQICIIILLLLLFFLVMAVFYFLIVVFFFYLFSMLLLADDFIWWELGFKTGGIDRKWHKAEGSAQPVFDLFWKLSIVVIRGGQEPFTGPNPRVTEKENRNGRVQTVYRVSD